MNFKVPSSPNSSVILYSGILFTPNPAEGTAFHIGLIFMTMLCFKVFVFE